MKQHKTYFAVFEPAKEGGFDVSFPSFPGCVTFGRTFEEAQNMAHEVLSLWLEELKKSKKSVPTPLMRPLINEISVAV